VAGAAVGALADGWEDVGVAEHAATRRLASATHAAITGMAPIRGDVADRRLRQDARVMAASIAAAATYPRLDMAAESSAARSVRGRLRDTLSPTLMFVARSIAGDQLAVAILALGLWTLIVWHIVYQSVMQVGA
jgi:hypothetical protein